MKRLIIIASIFAVIGTASFMMRPAHAEVIITDEQIEQIKNNCIENQATLNRLHQTDAFLRNDRGNLYRTIGDKLMVPFNRRLASNQLNGSSFLSITADYNREYTKFYDAYISYDKAMVKLLSTDCTRAPVSFYNALLDARAARTKLSAANQRVVNLVSEYYTTFTSFKASFLKEPE